MRVERAEQLVARLRELAGRFVSPLTWMQWGTMLAEVLPEADAILVECGDAVWRNDETFQLACRRVARDDLESGSHSFGALIEQLLSLGWIGEDRESGSHEAMIETMRFAADKLERDAHLDDPVIAARRRVLASYRMDGDHLIVEGKPIPVPAAALNFVAALVANSPIPTRAVDFDVRVHRLPKEIRRWVKTNNAGSFLS